MNILLSSCGLLDEKISASDKYLPVLTVDLEKQKTSPQKSPFVCQIPPRIQKLTPKSPELKKPSCTLTLGKGGIVTLKNQKVAQTILVTPTTMKQKPISKENTL